MSWPDEIPRATDGMTLDEFLVIPQEKPYQEFVDGRVTEKPGFTERQSIAISQLCFRLGEYVRAHAPNLKALLRLDHVHRSAASNRFFIPDLCLRDHAEMKRLGGGEIVATPPPFVAEIVLPEHSPRFQGDRTAFYMAIGTQVAWFIDAERQEIDVLCQGMPPKTYSAGSRLGIPGVVPGFEIAVENIFDLDD